MMSYPDELIRGIPNTTFVDMDNNYPNATLFNRFIENPDRDDDYNEASINWYDEEPALMEIFEKQNSEGEYQFKVGAAILSRMELDRLCKKPQIKGFLKYERRIVTGNDYHGNILLNKQTPKGLLKMIASGIALTVIDVRYREE